MQFCHVSAMSVCKNAANGGFTLDDYHLRPCRLPDRKGMSCLQVLVSHNRGKISEFFVGSVSQYVIKHCPVVTVLLH